MIVVVIIAAIISAVAVPSIIDQRRTTITNSMRSDVSSMKTALDKASLQNSGTVTGFTVDRRPATNGGQTAIMEVRSSTGEVLSTMNLADDDDNITVNIPSGQDTFLITVNNAHISDYSVTYDSSKG